MVAIGRVDAHQVVAGGRDVAVKADHVDPPLGEEPRMPRQVRAERPVIDRPEARGRSVGEGEVVAVLGTGEETMFSGELFVQAAEIQ